LAAGVAVAKAGNLVTYGIQPRFAATGYCYIKLGTALPAVGSASVNKVHSFIEKPDEAKAKKYLADGGYRWNSGIFTWKTDVVLQGLQVHCAWLKQALMPVADAWGSAAFDQVLNDVYQPLKKISIDYALMEKADNICVVTAAFTWDDVGSWDSLYDHLPKDAGAVITQGQVLAHDCHDSLIINQTQQMVTGIGLQGMSIIVTKDAILVVPKGKSQAVKQLVDMLKEQGRSDLL
jgi:mannose-1-phosphate guanylyltransferase